MSSSVNKKSFTWSLVSYFKGSKGGCPCQKGFLLLESLITLCALVSLMTFLAQWYVSYANTHVLVKSRLQALYIAQAVLGALHASKKVPYAKIYKEDGYEVVISVRPETILHSFYWVGVQVKSLDKSMSNVIELVSGLML